MELTLDGKTYKSKKVTLLTLLKCESVEKKMKEARDKEDWDAYVSLSVERCGLFLEGDVSELSPDLLSPTDAGELDSFFISRLAEALPKSDSTNEISSGSKASTQ